MARNSSGVYTLPAGNPVVTGTTITSTWANGTMSDIATEITNSLDRAGRGSMTAPFKSVDGTTAAPGMVFGSETTTGISRPVAGRMSFSVLAAEILRLTASGLSIVAGGLTISAGQLAVPAGTVGAPGVAFSGDLNNGWWAPAADTQAWSIAGAELMRLNSTGFGIRGAVADGHSFEVGGSASNGVIARFYGATVQSRGLSIDSAALNGVNGALFNFNAPGSASNGGIGLQASYVFINATDEYAASGFTANNFQIGGTTNGTQGMTMVAWPGANATAPDIQSLKSRGAAQGSRVIVGNGDNLLQITAAGDDGVDFIPAAQIGFQVDGTPGVGDVPGRMTFSVRAAGGGLTEVMRLIESGQVLIGATTALGSGAGHVTIRGSTPRTMLQVTSDAQTGRYEVYNAAGAVAGRLAYDVTAGRWDFGTGGAVTRLSFDSAALTVTGNVLPEASGTRSFGSTALEWLGLHGRSLTRTSAGALAFASTNVAGTITLATAGTTWVTLAANGRLQMDGGAYTTPEQPAHSATPTFDAATSNVFEPAAMTANITSMTISNQVAGQTIMIRFQQDATGGRTVALPAGAVVTGSVNTTANKVSWLTLTRSGRSGVLEGNWFNLP
jgi:hypothetical protein